MQSANNGLLKLFLCKKRYDFIMSIGQGCVTPEILKTLNIRRFAGPFDWTISDYDSTIKVIKAKFSNYFEKEDLEFAYFEKISCTDVYINKMNSIKHIHCFPASGVKDFEQAYPIAYETYKRRINRFIKLIEENKNPKILLLYIETANKDKDYGITNKDLEKDIQELNEIYGKNCFDILYIKHDERLGMSEYIIDDRILYINNTSTDMNLFHRGNYELTKKLIGKLAGLKIHYLIKNVRQKIKLTYVAFKTNVV